MCFAGFFILKPLLLCSYAAQLKAALHLKCFSPSAATQQTSAAVHRVRRKKLQLLQKGKAAEAAQLLRLRRSCICYASCTKVHSQEV